MAHFFILFQKNPVLQKQKLFYALQYSIDIQYINNLNVKIKHMIAKVSLHSAKKGHVPNQSLYKGWEQSFPYFCHDQKMDIIFCHDGQFIEYRNEIVFVLVRF